MVIVGLGVCLANVVGKAAPRAGRGGGLLPVFFAAGFADAGVEAILRVLFAVEGGKRRCDLVLVADVVFGGVFGATAFEVGERRSLMAWGSAPRSRM